MIWIIESFCIRHHHRVQTRWHLQQRLQRNVGVLQQLPKLTHVVNCIHSLSSALSFCSQRTPWYPWRFERSPIKDVVWTFWPICLQQLFIDQQDQIPSLRRTICPCSKSSIKETNQPQLRSFTDVLIDKANVTVLLRKLQQAVRICQGLTSSTANLSWQKGCRCLKVGTWLNTRPLQTA